MLEVSAISMSFGSFRALSDVSLSIAEGQKHAVIGPNGAGKTTFFDCITGHQRPTSGSVRFRGKSLVGMAPYRIVRLGVARSFQRINIYPRLTVSQNVQAALIADRGMTFDMFRPSAGLFRDEVRAALATVSLSEDEDQQAGLMSYGKQKQMELAIALASEPDLLLLDEPTAGMSPQETKDTIALIGAIAARRNLTLLFTEHDMAVVFAIADRISVLHHGEIIASGSPDAVRADPDVRRVYLGEAGDGAT